LGETGYAKVDAKTWLNARGLDFLRSFERVAELSKSREADVLVIAGDFFNKVNPHPRYIFEVLSIFRELAENGINVIVVSGNHEAPRLSNSLNPLRLFEHLRNVHVALEPKTISLDGVDFVCVPATPMLDSMASGFPIMLQKALAGSTSDTKVLVTHAQLSGAKFGSEMAMELTLEESIPAQTIPSKFVYTAMGHVHRFQQIPHPSVPVYYSGSSDRFTFAEEGEEKFAVEVNIEEFTKITPIRLGIRDIFTLTDKNCSNMNSQQIEQYVLEEITRQSERISESLVRIRLNEVDPHENRRLKISKIREALRRCGAFDWAIQPRPSVKRVESLEMIETYLFPPLKEVELYLKEKPKYSALVPDLMRVASEVINESKETDRTEA
jgi:DNA repair exonuclease SbcCD nuclease subunit